MTSKKSPKDQSDNQVIEKLPKWCQVILSIKSNSNDNPKRKK